MSYTDKKRDTDYKKKTQKEKKEKKRLTFRAKYKHMVNNFRKI